MWLTCSYVSFPNAEIVCENLMNPLNGQVSTTTLNHGGVATYECSVGYVIEGTATRMCEGNGTWSANAPICKSKLLWLDANYDENFILTKLVI